MIEINETIARKVLETVDAGLTDGLGVPVPGQMCVEAAVCYALGLPHSDDPQCVSESLRTLKILLNDSMWSTNDARASGMRRLAVAQLGSKDNLDEKEFDAKLVSIAIRVLKDANPNSLYYHDIRRYVADTLSASINSDSITVSFFATKAIRSVANAAYNAAAANAAANANPEDRGSLSGARTAAAAYDKVLVEFAEEVVQILIELKAPGTQWLYLTE
jgi:hypothetical protein